MKRLLKRWLAMALAVLMVVGTLPTTALPPASPTTWWGSSLSSAPTTPWRTPRGGMTTTSPGKSPWTPSTPTGLPRT